MLDIMSLHIPMRQGLRGRVASSCVILLGFPIFWVPKNCHLWWGDLILLQRIQGEGEIPLQDARRDREAITVICLLTLEIFLPEYEYHYSLNGNNKFGAL